MGWAVGTAVGIAVTAALVAVRWACDSSTGWRALYSRYDWRTRTLWRSSLRKGALVGGLRPERARALSLGWLERFDAPWWVRTPALVVAASAPVATTANLDLPRVPSLVFLVGHALVMWGLGAVMEDRCRRRCHALLAALPKHARV